MTTKKVTKLLAIVALAASPAAADPARLRLGTAPSSRTSTAVRTMGTEPGSRTEPWATATRPIAGQEKERDSFSAAQTDPWATATRPIAGQEKESDSFSAVPVLSLTALVELVAPRRMPSGAPACGNVATRAARAADCVRSKP